MCVSFSFLSPLPDPCFYAPVIKNLWSGHFCVAVFCCGSQSIDLPRRPTKSCVIATDPLSGYSVGMDLALDN